MMPSATNKLFLGALILSLVSCSLESFTAVEKNSRSKIDRLSSDNSAIDSRIGQIRIVLQKNTLFRKSNASVSVRATGFEAEKDTVDVPIRQIGLRAIPKSQRLKKLKTTMSW
jgi:hypothetical protein